MAIVGFILMAIGGIICLIYGIILLIKAFQESILWGLGYLFIPFVGLVFIFMHWDDCKSPFFRILIGTAIYVVGILLSGVLSGDMVTMPETP